MNPIEEIRIRRMDIEDIARVREIDVLSFAMPWPENSYRYEVQENEASRCWVAEKTCADGSKLVVGFLVIWLILDEAHVATIAVHPDYRGQKIGQHLLAEGLISAAADSAEMSYLEVRRSNLVAQAMYIQFGFEEVGLRPRYYHDNHEDAVLMTLHQIDPGKLEKFR